MTPHDQRAATDPTHSVEPEFSSTGTEAPRMSDERPVESDPIVDDASSARAEQSQAGEVSPAEAEPAQAGEVPPAAAEPAHAREVPPSADVQPSSENDVQPRRRTTSSRRVTNCSSPQTLPGCGRGGTTSRRRLSTTPQSACRRPTRSWRRSWNSSRQRSPRRAHGWRRSGREASMPQPRIFE